MEKGAQLLFHKTSLATSNKKVLKSAGFNHYWSHKKNSVWQKRGKRCQAECSLYFQIYERYFRKKKQENPRKENVFIFPGKFYIHKFVLSELFLQKNKLSSSLLNYLPHLSSSFHMQKDKHLKSKSITQSAIVWHLMNYTGTWRTCSPTWNISFSSF